MRLLEESPAPLVALNLKREIVLANGALGEWLGIDAEQLVGRRCDYQAVGGSDELSAVCAALCPPPEAFTGTITDGAVSRLAAGDRPFERRAARFVRLPGSEPDEGLLLVIVQPAAAETTPIEAPNHPLLPERLHAALVKLRSQLGQRFAILQLLGTSETMERVRQQVQIAAQTQARVLVVGPRGSGREQIARTIHAAQSSAAIGPLAPIDCSLVDAEQMQASLAALLRRQHESPGSGKATALLLEVDRLHPDAQQELAGFLHLPDIHLHTLATARRNLARLVARGKFRSDLAYELSTLTIVVPPLSQRREDIPLIAQHFLEEANAASPRQFSGFQPAAAELLATLPWPGNLDDLRRAVQEAMRRAGGQRIGPADLPDWVHLAKDDASREPRDAKPIQLDQLLADIEKELLQRALRRTRGNKSKAAELLGLSRQRLLRRLAQLGLIAPAEAEEPIVFEQLPDEP
jgi:transcriptional regulator with AAA-type ATPase domain